jgi:hypothetical protein
MAISKSYEMRQMVGKIRYQNSVHCSKEKSDKPGHIFVEIQGGIFSTTKWGWKCTRFSHFLKVF